MFSQNPHLVPNGYQRVMDNEIGIEESCLCTICWRTVIFPITIECGHAVCKYCLRNKTSPPLCCTSCFMFSQLRTHRVDIVMFPEGEGKCEIHREDQKLFCDNYSKLLCVTCSQSESHHNHIHWPIPVAAFRCRKRIQRNLERLHRNVGRLQKLLLEESEQPLIWSVAYIDYKIMNMKTLQEHMEKGKAKEELVETKNMKLNEIFQKLKVMEATQEHQIMMQKKEWEAKLSRKIGFLIDIVTEVEENIQKSDVEILQDITETLTRSSARQNFKPFCLSLDASYLNVVAEFLKLFRAHELLENCSYYDLSEEKKRAIIIESCLLGSANLVYITGSNETKDLWKRLFLAKAFEEVRFTGNSTFSSVI